MQKPDNSVKPEIDNEEDRRRTVHGLLGVPLAESREILWEALGDSSWRVRKEAVGVLVEAEPDADDISSLIELLRDDENAGLRNATAEAVMRIGANAVPALLPYLADYDHDVRKFVVDALSIIGGNDVIPGLIKALDDEDVNVASAAAEGLGASGEKSSVPALLRALEEHHHDFFRFNVLAALGKVGVPAPLPSVIRELASIEMLRRGVYECLGRIGGDIAAVDILLEGALSPMRSSRGSAICSLSSVLQNLDVSSRKRMIELLREVTDQGLMDNLLAAFNIEDITLSESVVNLLAVIADPRGVSVLLKALSDERIAVSANLGLTVLGKAALEPAIERFFIAEESERSAICFLLGQIGHNSDAVNNIIELSLSDSSPVVRSNAAQAVGTLASVELLSKVTNLLDDESQTVRDAALQTLRLRSACDRSLISEKAMQMLLSELPERRQAAALLFAAIDDAENLSRLIKDVDPYVREAAVRAVGKMRLPGTCSILVMALVDESEDVRIAAAESLGTCCNGAAVVPLRLALKDSDSWVQAAAIRSMVRLGGEQVLPDVIELWQAGDEVAQLACLEAFDLIAVKEGFEILAADMCRLDGEILKGGIEVLARHAPALLLPCYDLILAHREWDVRMSAVKACCLLPVDEIKKRLNSAIKVEQHDLVRLEINQILDRLK